MVCMSHLHAKDSRVKQIQHLDSPAFALPKVFAQVMAAGAAGERPQLLNSRHARCYAEHLGLAVLTRYTPSPSTGTALQLSRLRHSLRSLDYEGGTEQTLPKLLVASMIGASIGPCFALGGALAVAQLPLPPSNLSSHNGQSLCEFSLVSTWEVLGTPLE